jgi:hypothetical protein
MQTVFQNALYHAEPTILLRRLCPLSLGHLHQLYAAESAYVTGEPINLFDLVFAVAICSRTWEQGLAWLHSPTLKKDCKAWGRKASAQLNFRKEGEKFRHYLDEYTQLPKRWHKQGIGQGRPFQHPWTLILATELLPMVGESRAWNMPLPLALSYWSARQELQYGDDTLENPGDERARALQLAYMADQAKKAAGA